jgi:hypothetical protein
MIRLITDATLPDKLKDVADHAQICDESGQLLGHYLSREAYLKFVYEWADRQIDDQEIERRLQEEGGYTLDEIWRSLGQP